MFGIEVGELGNGELKREKYDIFWVDHHWVVWVFVGFGGNVGSRVCIGPAKEQTTRMVSAGSELRIEKWVRLDWRMITPELAVTLITAMIRVIIY